MNAILSYPGMYHDLWLVLLAALICSAGAGATMRLFVLAATTVGVVRPAWTVLASLMAGATLWSTHFVAMLAYLADGPAQFDPVLTLVSLLIAIGGAQLSMLVSAVGREGPWLTMAGGMLGLTISAMHYVGVRAYHIDGVAAWRADVVLLSCALAMIFAALAMAAVRSRLGGKFGKGAAAFLLVAVISLHFAGVAALNILPLANAQRGSEKADHSLAVATTLAGLLIVAACAFAYIIGDRGQVTAKRRLVQAGSRSQESIIAAVYVNLRGTRRTKC